jgi:hypothetical protein
MDNSQNSNQIQKADIDSKLQQSGITESELNKAGYYKNPVFDFLKTEPGSQIGKCVVDLMGVYVQKYHATHKWDTVAKVGCIIAVVAATTGLLFWGKFDPSVGILFGTIVGYLFGKNQKE